MSDGPGVIPALASALDEVRHEIVNAVDKHGLAQTPLSKTMYRSEKFIILMEEIGEVAHLLTYDGNPGDFATQRENLRRELIQVAAMAVAWLVSE